MDIDDDRGALRDMVDDRQTTTGKSGSVERVEDRTSTRSITPDPTASRQSSNASSMTSPKKGKQRQKKTNAACLPCQRSHYPCDEGRPCQSCLRRGRPAQCVDGMKKRAKYLELAMSPMEQYGQGFQTGNSHRTPAGSEQTNDGAEAAASARLHLPADSSIYSPFGTVSSSMGDPYSDYLDTSVIEDPLRVVPYDYASSYHRILDGLQRRLTTEGMGRVCQAFARFRPSLIAHLRTLDEADLVLMERLFRRTMRDLRTILPLTGAPHAVWRRTGEMAWISPEFSLLTGWSPDSLADGRRTIFEILGEHAIVNYWEQYAMCVLERGHTAFRVMGSLLKPDGRALPGAWWMTVKKDIFDIPLVLIGCFLPNLWQMLDTGTTTMTSPEDGQTDSPSLATQLAQKANNESPA